MNSKQFQAAKWESWDGPETVQLSETTGMSYETGNFHATKKKYYKKVEYYLVKL